MITVEKNIKFLCGFPKNYRTAGYFQRPILLLRNKSKTRIKQNTD